MKINLIPPIVFMMHKMLMRLTAWRGHYAYARSR
jgi:hypothetical protein